MRNEASFNFFYNNDTVRVVVDERNRDRMMGRGNDPLENRFRGAFAGCFHLWQTPDDVLWFFEAEITRLIREAISNGWLEDTQEVVLKSDKLIGWKDFIPADESFGFETEPLIHTNWRDEVKWEGERITAQNDIEAPATHMVTAAFVIKKDSGAYRVTFYTLYPGLPTGRLQGEVRHITFLDRRIPGEFIDDDLAEVA